MTVSAINQWYKGCEKKERDKSLAAWMAAFDSLREMIDEQIEQRRVASENGESFKEPNWEYQQAYTLGRIKGLREVLIMLPKIKD